MDIGITLTANAVRGVQSRDSVQHIKWAARYADEHGFDNVWSTEHHFTEIAHSGSPAAILGYYAGVTQRVKIGYAVAIVPLQHPMRLAEEISWLDNLSNGRLIGGVSPGWSALEFGILGVPILENRERFAEGFDIVKLALSGESFSYNGKHWQIPEVKMLPQPIQKPLPFVMATTSNESVANAARWKVGALLGFRSMEGLAEQRKLYIDTCIDEGYSQEEIDHLLKYMGVLRRIIVADSDEAAEEEALRSAVANRATTTRLMTPAGASAPLITEQMKLGFAEVEPRDTGAYLGVVGGTPDTITKKLLDIQALGIGHVLCGFTHGQGQGLDDVKNAIRRFSSEVIPAFKAESK